MRKEVVWAGGGESGQRQMRHGVLNVPPIVQQIDFSL